jgi:acyl carrier protein
MRKSLETTVYKTLACISKNLEIEIDDLNSQSKIGAFPEWDSMGHITIYFAIQKEFAISIPLDKAGDIRSVEDWARAIDEQLS